MRWKVLVSSFIIVFLVALIGNFFTSGNVKSEWYESIKPAITPPNYVFPIVWTILFILIALSLYFAWIKARKEEEKNIVVLVFTGNLFLNIIWSFLFFTLKNPLYAFYHIFLLEFSIILMIVALWKIEKKAAYLLIPYLLWVSFAMILNYLAI